MKPKELRPGVYWVGAIDWDRRLFDSLIPLPDGTSYNSYLIRGSQKTVLIDAVDPSMQDISINCLTDFGITHIDYVVANHAEQDHSGTLPRILEIFPETRVICTPRCKGLLIDLLMIPEEKFATVAEGDTLSLGDKTLEFIYTPWVHWPETMSTYLLEEKILFSCDFFGSHLATTSLYVTDKGQAYDAAKRYYAEIMMPYRTTIAKNLKKLDNYAIDIIATSHGPVYDEPEFIMKAYQTWVFDQPTNTVVIPFTSMHNSTRKMVEYLVAALDERGVAVQQFDLEVTDLGKLAVALVEAATVVVGTPTVLAGPHPNVVSAVFLANALRPKLRFASIIGSYGWGGRTVEQLTAMMHNLKVDILEPVLSKGFPKEPDFKALDTLAATISEKHRENDFVWRFSRGNEKQG
ncbi:MAG: FprA family A-type flavoprotein [Dehalococcoidales bacterium]|jgi:flavorubredoxin|nr:FprA family A-type flavoprotein [Dehalococcoidales bacterium]